MRSDLFDTQEFKQQVVSPTEEHLFRRWQSGVSCKELADEAHTTESKMLSTIAKLWRKLGRQ